MTVPGVLSRGNGAELVDYLIDCIERATPSALTIHDARTSLEIAPAAYQSAREGRTIRLEPRSPLTQSR